MKVPTAGGTAIMLADSIVYNGTSWTENGEILFTKGPELWRVSADGGAPRLLARPDSGRGHVGYRWPHALPGGRAALVTIVRAAATLDSIPDYQLGVVSLRDGQIAELGIAGTSPRYLPSGQLVFARTDGSILAAPFSLRRMRPTGPAVTVLEGVQVKVTGGANFDSSDDGMVVYATGALLGRLVMVDRQGNARDLLADPQPYHWPRLSPDGRRLTLSIGSGPFDDVWTYDLASRTLSRLTTGGNGANPEWTPDGRRIAYWDVQIGKDRLAGGQFLSRPWDGSGAAERYVQTEPPPVEVAFGPPGGYVLEIGPRISPDGSLLAYVSDESGRDEVYLRPLPGSGPRVQVSAGGGLEPMWSRDGRTIVYRGNSHLVAATIRTSPELGVVRRDSLAGQLPLSAQSHAMFDVFPNGDLVMVQGASEGNRVFAIVNWTEEVRRRTEAAGASRSPN